MSCIKNPNDIFNLCPEIKLYLMLRKAMGDEDIGQKIWKSQ